jgi:hypothetical protein
MRLLPHVVLLLLGICSIPSAVGFGSSRPHSVVSLRPPGPPFGSRRTSTSSKFVASSQPESSSSYGFPEEVEETDCPKGYFLDSVHNSCTPLGPLGRISQAVENFGPLQKASQSISNLFGMDTKQISKLGIGFALSYSIISNINGSITLSVAWYLSCKRVSDRDLLFFGVGRHCGRGCGSSLFFFLFGVQTGLSPLEPGQWKSLLAAYGTIYAGIQLLRPFRVAAAVAMSKLSKEFLDSTQQKLSCSRTVSIAIQYALGWIVWAGLAAVGVLTASVSSGVPIR